MIGHLDVILALLLSPFIASCCVMLAVAVTWVWHIERRPHRYFSPQTDAARRRLHAEAERGAR